jgi:hypothetical protein
MPDIRLVRAVPVMVVVLVGVVGLLFVASGHWRKGAAVLAAAAGVGAMLRLAVPDRWIGPLQVRGRPFDVAFLGALALLLTLATTVGF